MSSLPRFARAEIMDAVRRQRVVCLNGETGCGKSTGVPLALLRCGDASASCRAL